jgi:hypothetical protein
MVEGVDHEGDIKYPRFFEGLEPAVRVELTTGGLRNRCSTTELRWHVPIIYDGLDSEQRSVNLRFPTAILSFSPVILSEAKDLYMRFFGRLAPSE